jgi:hypothetical protein
MARGFRREGKEKIRGQMTRLGVKLFQEEDEHEDE